MSRNFGGKSDWKAVTWTLAREMIIKCLELFYTRKQIDKTEKMSAEEKESEERKKERKVRDFYYLKLCTGDVSNKRKICGREAIYQLPVSRNRGLGNTVHRNTKFFDVIIFRC